MIIVFDLDDTLYEEITYVKSGFMAVASFLALEHDINKSTLFRDFNRDLEKNPRGNTFDRVLKNYNIFTKTLVKKCLSVYRLHEPVIAIHPEAQICLNRFKRQAKYIVTDGNKIVQSKKITHLCIAPLFKKVFITHRYGIKNSKPSTYCFRRIIKMEKSRPENLVYIGDNPNKDFVNLKKEGFKTIRVRTGHYKDLSLTDDFEAHLTINALDELNKELLRELASIKE